MNRTIKFRAWFNGKEKMVYNLGFDDRSFITLDDPTLEEDEMPSVWDKDCIVDDSYYEGAFSYELMQYTGLKDKNGKEIYEGDIISRENTYENNCVVKWDDESCGFTLNYIYFDESYNMNEFWDDFEVIGNIYENKDLLKEEE